MQQYSNDSSFEDWFVQNVGLDTSEISVDNYINESLIPPSHKDLFRKSYRSKFSNKWFDINTNEFFISLNHLMCPGIFAFNGDNVLFLHLYIDKNDSRAIFDLDKYLEKIKRDLDLTKPARIVLVRSITPYYTKMQEGTGEERLESFFIEKYLEDTMEIIKRLGEWADENKVEINLLDVRYQRAESSLTDATAFSLTFGEGKIVVWDSKRYLPIAMYNLEDLRDWKFSALGN